ncbi:MAG: substrate-binding domain-containing protein [Deferribacterales bacterium]
MRHFYFTVLLTILTITAVSCGAPNPLEKDNTSREILVYSAMAVSDAVADITDLYNQTSGCRAVVLYGGSSHLKYAVEATHLGDVFIPGIGLHNDQLSDKKIILRVEKIGYYTPVLYVRKNNPLRITGDLSALTDPTIRVGLGSPVSSGIGLVTADLLKKEGVYDEVMHNAVVLASDSRQLMNELTEGRVDVVIGWAHSGSEDYFSRDIAAIALNTEVKGVPMSIGLLKYTKNRECSEKFIEMAVSEQGKAVFNKYSDIE